MTMIEKVARAIAAHGGSDWDKLPKGHSPMRKMYESMAWAAIEAMREPTEGMNKCSDEVHWNYSCHVCGGLADGWRAMIDAALKGKDR